MLSITLVIFAIIFSACIIIGAFAWCFLLLTAIIRGETKQITEHPLGENYVTLPNGQRRLD